MILESMHGFQHISDVLTGNAIATIIYFDVALIAIKLLATVSATMVRDNAGKMEWYRQNVEGKTLPSPQEEASS
jgi:hypothetical protein